MQPARALEVTSEPQDEGITIEWEGLRDGHARQGTADRMDSSGGLTEGLIVLRGA